jgi:hypothetical protein
MPLVSGNIPPQFNVYPASPQELLFVFASYLTAPPARRSVFVANSSSGIPMDGSSLWLDTASGTLKAYFASGWQVVLGSRQVSNTIASAVSTSQVVALSNSAPSSTAGTVVVGQQITPRSATNRVLVTATMPVVSISTGAATVTAFIQAGPEGTAFAATSVYLAGPDQVDSMVIRQIHSPATTAPITYNLRFATTAATAYLNRTQSHSDLWAGSPVVTLTLEEIV